MSARHIFTQHLDIVYFLYGLAFLGLGFFVLARIRRTEKIEFKLFDILWLLGLFAILHGANEFADMLILIKGESPYFTFFRDMLTVVSFAFLFWFGFRLININHRTLGTWFPALFAFLFFVLPIAAGLSTPNIWTISARYFLAMPATLLCAVGFSIYYRDNLAAMNIPQIKKYFSATAVFFALYAFLTGLMVPKSYFFPPNILNQEAFFMLFDVPVQVFRALFAVVASWSIWNIIRVFNIEEDREHRTAEEKVRSVAKFPSEDPHPVLRVAKDGTIMYANAASGPLLREWGSEIGRPAPADWRRVVTEVLETEIVRQDVEIRLDGRIFSFTLAPVENTYINLYGRDISAEKLAEMELRRARDELEERVEARTVELKETNATLREEIAERMQAQEALADKEGESRSIIQTASETICKLDSRGYYLFMSPDGLKTHGITEDEIVGKPCTWIVKPEYRERFEENCAAARSGSIRRFEYESDTVRGPRWFEGVMSPQKDASGAVSALIFVSRDITDRKRQAELRDSLNGLNATISSTLDFAAVMEQVVEEAGKVVDCGTTSILLRENDDWTVRYLVGELPIDMIGRPLGAEELQFISAAIKYKKPIISNDVYEDSRFNREAAEKYRIRSLFCIPLIVKEDIRGVLLFIYHEGPRQVSEAEIDFMIKLGVSVSLAMENAQLYASQLHIAETLQESLLTIPKSIEGIRFGHLYRSAVSEVAKVGGDFYDIFELDGNRVCISIGDVSGKGVKAATLTSLAKNTIRAYAYRNHFPAEVIAMTNNVIQRAAVSPTLVTIYFGILDKRTGILSYCNAGHSPPIIKRKRGRVFELQTSGPAIGVFSDLRYEDFEEKLGHGDILIGYTDGVPEARIGKRLFGEERLLELIGGLKDPVVEIIPDQVLLELLKAGCVLTDDIALVAISPADESK
jgi:PAS domain S-box-containing protein